MISGPALPCWRKRRFAIQAMMGAVSERSEHCATCTKVQSRARWRCQDSCSDTGSDHREQDTQNLRRRRDGIPK